MSLTFYFSPMSTAEITRAVLAELGTPHETVMVDLRAGDTKKPDFLKVNPNGRVPAIVHEGVPIWESAAITMYLGEMFGVDAGLYPAAGPKRGEAMKWIAWSNVTLAEAGSRLGSTMMPPEEGVSDDRDNSGAADKARTDLARGLAILDGGLAGKPFLLGEYSLVDTHLHSIVTWLGFMQVDLKPFTQVTGWMARCSERPALAELMAG